MRRLRVLLDANVVVNAQVRDLICRLAEAELLDVRWSAAIVEETRRALIEGLGLDPSKVDRLLDALGRAFPAASVEGFERLLGQLELPDPDDRHVLAAVIHGECDLLVTDNVSDFPPATMERFDIVALTADDAIALLATQLREQMADIVEDQIVALRRPAMTRDEFLADVAAGHDAALLAWRRDDVRDLNRLAWDLHRDQGSLSGPELEGPGGRRYAAGDRIVVLAPLPDQDLVTSERLTVTAIDIPNRQLHATTNEGRRVTLAGQALDAEHLDHGYALTVHRAQGATYDRVHVLAAGGGRELAYVALSRARHGTTLHTVADDLDQVRHDLTVDWGADQAQRWITGSDPSGVQPGLDLSPAPSPTPSTWPEGERPLEERQAQAYRRVLDLEDDLHDLLAGTGRWQHTPEGAAARRFNAARDALDTAAAEPPIPTSVDANAATPLKPSKNAPSICMTLIGNGTPSASPLKTPSGMASPKLVAPRTISPPRPKPAASRRCSMLRCPAVTSPSAETWGSGCEHLDGSDEEVTCTAPATIGGARHHVPRLRTGDGLVRALITGKVTAPSSSRTIRVEVTGTEPVGCSKLTPGNLLPPEGVAP